MIAAVSYNDVWGRTLTARVWIHWLCLKYELFIKCNNSVYFQVWDPSAFISIFYIYIYFNASWNILRKPLFLFGCKIFLCCLTRQASVVNKMLACWQASLTVTVYQRANNSWNNFILVCISCGWGTLDTTGLWHNFIHMQFEHQYKLAN